MKRGCNISKINHVIIFILLLDYGPQLFTIQYNLKNIIPPAVKIICSNVH